MLLSQLFEAINKQHAAFCFGRMNPPTVGHGQLIDTVAQAAAGGDYFIFTSQTQDSKKNPLDYATKVKFIKAMFPQQANHVVYDPSLKTIMQVAVWLYNKGYRKVTFVAGSDRLENFKELLTKYNGVEGPAGMYKFDSIDFVSSGDRDPDADGIAGVSASAAREAAKAGNLAAFAQATGAGELAEPLYLAVRKGMLLDEGWKGALAGAALIGGIGGAMYAQPQPYVEIDGVNWRLTSRTPGILAHPKVVTAADGKKYQIWRGAKNRHLAHPIDDKQVDEHIVKHGSGYRLVSKKTGKNLGDFPTKAAAQKHEREVQYFKHTNEGASGYIPKNKREAKDPRWSNALTVDVHPDTPNKNLKALRLK